ncbi:hypothetical protein L6452_33222 [Arctium lappa]|uniref:Uncharacterized protein n=1 Tax=Arctium lappa TaxID=4217 RepID=A0ACB8Z748_ARCLA|nr:hypothetical protein L6452_33222 [Arctium lappa]
MGLNLLPHLPSCLLLRSLPYRSVSLLQHHPLIRAWHIVHSTLFNAKGSVINKIKLSVNEGVVESLAHPDNALFNHITGTGVTTSPSPISSSENFLSLSTDIIFSGRWQIKKGRRKPSLVELTGRLYH